MIGRLAFACALAASLVPTAAAQQGAFWTGAKRLKCMIETASTCDSTNCTPLTVAPVVLVDLAAMRTCASRDGATCSFQYYPITRSDQTQGGGRLLLVVRGTGTTYSILPDGQMSGASVVAPKAHVYLGRCELG